MLKLLLYMLTILSCADVYATVGGSNGGGGARIEAAFRIRARELIVAIAANSKANEFCSAEAMKTALSSKIRVVEKIEDPNGRCNASHDACSYPGDIQLKKESWKNFADTSQAKIGNRSTDAMILHEIYRAAKSCNDEDFIITNEVLPLIASTPAAFAPPKYTWKSCFTTEIIRDKNNKVKTEEFTYEETSIEWSDGVKSFSLGGIEQEPKSGKKTGTVVQSEKTRTSTNDPELEFFTIKTKYFDISSGTVSIANVEKRFEARGPKQKYVVSDVTNANPSKNLAKIHHTHGTGPDGYETLLMEQLDPDPVASDGSRRLSHKVICTRKVISAEAVDYSGIFKVKRQAERFSKSHEKTMLAKDLWQSCQEKNPAANCSLQKAAYDKSETERKNAWNRLLKESDFGSGGGDGGNGGSGGGTCSNKQAWAEYCIPVRCSEFCSYAASWYEYCTGRKAPWGCRPNYPPY